MKRKTSVVTAFILSMTLLAGCGNSQPTALEQSSENSGTQSETTASASVNESTESSSETENEQKSEKSISIAQSAPFSMGFGQGVMVYENAYYADNFYEPLVKYQDGEYVPCLATEWSKSEDGLTYTFILREGVRFNDGTDLNAQAVKLYFDNMRPILGASTNYGQFDMLTTEITADDDHTVSFHLSRPYYNVLNDISMAMPRGILWTILFRVSVHRSWFPDRRAEIPRAVQALLSL